MPSACSQRPNSEECCASLGSQDRLRTLERVQRTTEKPQAHEPLSARPNYPKRGRHLKALQAPQKRAQSRSGGVEADILESVAPPLYFEALAGVFVPARRRDDQVPAPGPRGPHPELSGVARSWSWLALLRRGRGGTVIDLVAYLTGLEPRGSGYIQIREYAAERLLEKGGGHELRPN